jgi:hypothetical protein
MSDPVREAVRGLYEVIEQDAMRAGNIVSVAAEGSVGGDGRSDIAGVPSADTVHIAKVSTSSYCAF